jgi:group I intron endonuclease
MNTSKRRGIYFIHNLANYKIYVGSTGSNFSDRWSVHLAHLRKNRHPNQHLQSAWSLYGENCFSFGVLEDCPKENRISREQWWFDLLHPEYNILPVAGTNEGFKHTEESKRKIGDAFRGKKLSIEHRSKMTGRVRSEEHRANLSIALRGNQNCRGNVPTKETRTKISLARIGIRVSSEARRKISQTKTGQPWSEARRKVYEARYKSHE